MRTLHEPIYRGSFIPRASPMPEILAYPLSRCVKSRCLPPSDRFFVIPAQARIQGFQALALKSTLSRGRRFWMNSGVSSQPVSPSCYRLFPDPGIEEFQWLDPDPFLPRARGMRTREPPDAERVRLVCNKKENRGQRACARQNLTSGPSPITIATSARIFAADLLQIALKVICGSMIGCASGVPSKRNAG